MLTDEIKGKPVAKVSAMTNQDVLDNLGIEISPARLKCALLSVDTLRKALAEHTATLPPRRPADDGCTGDRCTLRQPAADARVPGRPAEGWRPPLRRPPRPDPSPRRPALPTHPTLEPTQPMSKTFAELMRDARASISQVSPGEAELARERGARFVDVRESSEWDEGYIPGSALIAKSYLEQQIEGQVATATRR